MKLSIIVVFIFGCCWLADGQAVIDINEQYQLGNEALNNFQYQKALDHFYECHRVDTKNKNYLQKLAYCYMKLGDYGEAKLSYQTLLKKDSTNVNAWSNLGSIYEKESNYAKAGECYQELLGIDSTNSYYFRQNAMMALRTDNPLLALVHFSKAHELNPKDVIVINQLGSLILQFDQPDQAQAIIQGGLRFAPNNYKLLYTKADILHRKKDYENLVETISHAMSLGDTVQYYQKMIGAAYLHLEAYDSCIYHLNRIIEKGQESDLTYYQLAIAYRSKGDLDKGAECYQLAIKRGISENVGTYYKNMALIFDEQKKYKAAIAAWKKAIEYSPEEEVYLFHLAQDCDKYYRDKKIARRYYRKYYDTKHEKYREYAKERIQYLNGVIHQRGE
ncbi:MAG: tetratricopeptide repeat protein [Bacteroidota bacterium]